MKVILAAALLVAFAVVAPVGEAHIGTEGGCSTYDVDVNPSHWHVCAGTVDIKNLELAQGGHLILA